MPAKMILNQISQDFLCIFQYFDKKKFRMVPTDNQ